MLLSCDRAARPAFLALSLLACSPTTVWHGRSADRTRAAVIVEEAGRHRLSVDGREVGAYDAIAVTHLRWTPRGLVYAAREGTRWRVVIDGAPGPAFEAIGELVVEGERVAYAARDGEGWRVVIDGEVGPPFRALIAGSLVLEPERRRAAYVGRDDEGERAVIDGEVGPPFERVARLRFGAKGTLVGYVGIAGDGTSIVIDGRAGPPYEAVLELALADDAPRWAAVVREGDARAVLVDGARVAAGEDLREVRIAGDGAHVAWLAPRDGGVDVVQDGVRVGHHSDVERLQHVPRTGALLYVARGQDHVRVVHDGRVGPRLRAVVELVTSPAGHYGYVGARRGGRAVVIDGALRFRGEWAGALALAREGNRHAFLTRRAGARYVVTAEGEGRVPAPFADTLVLDPSGRHVALAVAGEAPGTLGVWIDGATRSLLDPDELAAMLTQGHEPAAAARAIVAGELARAIAARPRSAQ